MSGLRELQTAFARAVFDEDAAAVFSRHLRRNGLDGERRVQIYRNNHRISLREALAAVYPATQRLVGEDFFRQTARAYVCTVHSVSGDIHRYGDGFADFLAGLPSLADYPYLADVARLEWAYHSVFHSAQAAALDLAALAGVAADAYPSLRFRLQPAARLIASAYPLLRIWQVNLDDWRGDRAVDLGQGPARLLLMRAHDGVTLAPLTPGEYRVLERFAAGDTLADAHAAAAADDPDLDLAAALRRFVADAVLVGFSLDRSGAAGDGLHSTSEV